MLEKRGLKTVPSPSYTGPNSGNYYSGGFITLNHGSFYTTAKHSNAIQIELPFYMRQESVVSTYAKTTADAIFEFYTTHLMDKQRI